MPLDMPPHHDVLDEQHEHIEASSLATASSEDVLQLSDVLQDNDLIDRLLQVYPIVFGGDWYVGINIEHIVDVAIALNNIDTWASKQELHTALTKKLSLQITTFYLRSVDYQDVELRIQLPELRVSKRDKELQSAIKAIWRQADEFGRYDALARLIADSAVALD